MEDLYKYVAVSIHGPRGLLICRKKGQESVYEAVRSLFGRVRVSHKRFDTLHENAPEFLADAWRKIYALGREVEGNNGNT